MRVLIVPGAAVRQYARPAVGAVASRGIDARLLPAPGEPGAPADLQNYGEELARRISTGSPLDLLVGLSVGAQAVAVAATAVPTGQVRHVMLISPTVDPNVRTGHPSRPHARSAN